MVSLQGRLFNILLKLVNKKILLKKQFHYNKFDLFWCSEPPKKILASCNVEKAVINGRNVFTLKPLNGAGEKHILYLHGGAYVQSFSRPHWDFLYFLVKSLNCTITAPDYPLAPANTFVQTFAMVSEVYKRLVDRVNPENFILMGDSAGGGLALALAQLMKNEKMPQASQIILLSPWLDIGLNDPQIKDIDPSDLFLDLEGLQLAGKAYSGGENSGNYLLSPINGPLDGLGKISVFIGSREILVVDARKLKAMADEKGIELNYFEYPGMFHAWILLYLPESKKARQQVLDLIQQNANTLGKEEHAEGYIKSTG